MKLNPKYAGSAALMWLLATVGCSLLETSPAPPLPVSAEDISQTRMSLAKLKERHGETSQAAELYQAILGEDPQNQAAHHRLAVIAAQEQQLELADHHFEQALASGRPTAELLNDRAYAYYLQDDLDLAEKIARQALALEPHNKAARTNLALILGDKGQFDASLTEFRKVVSEAEAQSNLAYVKAMAGDLKGAEETYHYALQKDSTLRPAAHALLELNDRRTGVVRDVAPEILAVGPRSEDRPLPASNSHPDTSPTGHSFTAPDYSQVSRASIGDTNAPAESYGNRPSNVQPAAHWGDFAQPQAATFETSAGQPWMIPGAPAPGKSMGATPQDNAPWSQATW